MDADVSPPEPVPDDGPARARIAESLDESLIVEAAAGTGKTTVLVRRLVAVLRTGRATVDRVVAVTFTRKAAGQLKLRLREELDRERLDPRSGSAERRRLEAALARLEEARIGTIHGFCAELLRERPVEAGIDPAFREADDEEARSLYDRTFRRWMEDRLADPPTGLRRALSRLALGPGFDGTSPVERLRDAGWSLVDWRDFEAPWRREPYDRDGRIAGLLAQVARVGELARRGRPDDYLRRALEPVLDLEIWHRGVSELATADADETEARLVDLRRQLRRHLGWKGRSKSFAAGLLREEVLAARDALIEALETFRNEADADLAALLQGELAGATAAYEEAKRQVGRLDFLDLLVRARDLVRDRPEVRRGFQERFSHLFVDELQDTDPLQAEILLLLAADDPAVSDWRQSRPVPGKLFLVGDPKQSIYRFRRADVLLYRRIRDRLAAAGVAQVRLTRSFRSLEPLQRAVNAAFRLEMQGDPAVGQPDYVPLGPHRKADVAQPAIVALPVPYPYGWTQVTAQALEAGQPALVAAWLDWLLTQSGWTIEDPESPGTRIPIAPRHVALLFRRFVSWGDDLSRQYTRELDGRAIPHLLVGGRSFYQREEVETLVAALHAVEHPDDELAVFATLKGSLFAIDDGLLLRWRHQLGAFHPFGLRPDGEEAERAFLPIVEGLNLLRDLHRDRNRQPFVQVVQRLLAATRAHAGFALRPAGQQVLANVQRVCELARAFEVRGGLSFRAFVDRLADEAARPGTAVSAVVEDGADGVRLLTVHTAKGLEFPVVVLADVSAALARDEPDRYLDAETGLAATRVLGCSPWELLEQAEVEAGRDRAEGVRLAYVAATRARDLLAVPVVGDGRYEEGWVSPLVKALYPLPALARKPRPAPGCPPFGDRSVLGRPAALDGQPEGSVAPGLHRPEVGDHEVVWWDPAALELDTPGRHGLREEQLLADDGGGAAQAGLDRWEAWQDARAEVTARGSEPEHRILIVSETEEDPPAADLDAELTVERVPRPANRPAGRRFGTLVHTVLRDVAYDADEPAVRALATLHGRLADAPPAEVDAAVTTVLATLRHALLTRAATARSEREAPFVVPLSDGTLVEGSIDLAFEEGDGWTVVDFKTDADDADLLVRYRRQLGWYVWALRKVSGRPVRGVLLSV